MALVVALSACSFFEAKRMPVNRDHVLVDIELVDELPPSAGVASASKKFGDYSCDGDFCHVRILRKTYPFCVTHEIRHVFEGDWHGQHASTEDCKP